MKCIRSTYIPVSYAYLRLLYSSIFHKKRVSTLLEDLVVEFPKYSMFHMLLARRYDKGEHYKKAIEQWTFVLQSKETTGDAYCLQKIAYNYYKLGDTENVYLYCCRLLESNVACLRPVDIAWAKYIKQYVEDPRRSKVKFIPERN